jgi:hypothetical protein
LCATRCSMRQRAPQSPRGHQLQRLRLRVCGPLQVRAGIFPCLAESAETIEGRCVGARAPSDGASCMQRRAAAHDTPPVGIAQASRSRRSPKTMLAGAQVARWQSSCMDARDPTDQQRSWLLNKIRTDLAMRGTKLNARVLIKNLQNMHEESSHPREREEGWSLSIRTGLACKAEDHTRADTTTA